MNIRFSPVGILSYSVCILTLKHLGNVDCPKKKWHHRFLLRSKVLLNVMNGRLHWQGMSFSIDKINSFLNNLP